ncbi:transmembrane and ubiquitin-like domain-containing protein 1 [Esox lucius]|uniref:Transmembrane and ubiquitin-like domain-containing protein 1 n=1 Tax=Esox lucius TaxID=8010 RepID=A0AAY5KVV0_ESOLU|nr:transmembrane and ubiquitin-like domain-containing protein 1 [Esox lucius]XP_010891560.2 transmembrane and ubiquitin-like domain-containing protein 1 [Esox lucius]
MTLIEGVGDEVTLLFGAVLLLLVLVLAWASTHTAEPPEHLFTTPPASASSVSAALHLRSASSDQQPVQSDVTTGESSNSPESSSAPSSVNSLNPPLGEEGKAERGSQIPEGDGRGRGAEEEGAGGEGNLLEEGSPLSDGLRHRDGVGGGQTGASTGTSPSHPTPNPLDSASSTRPPPEVEPADATERNMVLRLKFLNDTERTAQVKPEDTIGYIKRTYFAGQEHQVRLIYQGQLLQDDGQTLASLNLADNCVLHCHISQHATRAAPAGARAADQVQVALNVGSLMVPLFVLMLSVLWYFQIQYRQFFTAPATASLVGITIFFSFVAFGVYRR